MVVATCMVVVAGHVKNGDYTSSPPGVTSGEYELKWNKELEKQKALMAIQITLFPSVGIALVSRNSSLVNKCLLADYNRDFIKDIDPHELITSKFMKDKWNWDDMFTTPILATNKLQLTFIMKRAQVELLKNWVSIKLMEENGLETIKLGNYLEPHFASAKRSKLRKEDIVIVAAKAIGRLVIELRVPREAEKLLSKIEERFKSGNQVIRVATLPRLGVYEIDFGWERAWKTEVAHIGSLGSISMAENREDEGGVEFGLALSYYWFTSKTSHGPVERSSQCSKAHIRCRPNCLMTFWTTSAPIKQSEEKVKKRRLSSMSGLLWEEKKGVKRPSWSNPKHSSAWQDGNEGQGSKEEKVIFYWLTLVFGLGIGVQIEALLLCET
ncbi:hypothetical protein F3Y22_tig00110987pilonHSYRG00350 [Hibiscus syriacus]|uniref:Uncharacterized protein n=1 Tax=Hibiscus syriacus TaxID=106335 RepID=A0A6A2ZA49_HIBSY|nr:hypothetical protein F3Y22_tig00110987pilonHSYRG00350 [Hibiscus syriacus]